LGTSAGATGLTPISGPFCPHDASKAKALVASTRAALATTLPVRLVMLRLSTVSTALPNPDDLSDAEYDRRTRAVLASVEAAADRLLQDDVIDIDASRTGGLLELAFPNGSRIVINTQPPLHELWLAAGDGGYHFRSLDGRWIDGRQGREFFEVLSACASAQAGRPLRFEAGR
jgi:CyaY protein